MKSIDPSRWGSNGVVNIKLAIIPSLLFESLLMQKFH